MSTKALSTLLCRNARQAFLTKMAPGMAVRGFKDHEKSMRRSLYRRRIEQGPEPERPASAWVNWNYDLEIYCFGKRLHEEFNEETLKQAFVDKSYVEKERQRREEVGMGDEASVDRQLQDNQTLAQLGDSVVLSSLEAFFTSSLPHVPAQGIRAMVDHFSSDRMLAHIANNLGLKDLALTQEFPPSDVTMATCMRAVVAALHTHQGSERSGLFVRDFIGAQMVGERVDEVWVVDDPMTLLTQELTKRGFPKPEPRLLWASGTNTILSNYEVGVYCDRQLIGQSSGQSVSLAEEMAARDALRTLYRTQTHHTPLIF